MQLFLLRHAEAEAQAPTDEERPLTAKGVKQAKTMGRFCYEQQIAPRPILCSPLARAEETAKLVARELRMSDNVQIEDFLRAGMSPEQALLGLEKYHERASVMLVGHEPDLSELAGCFIGTRGENIHFRKAALLQISLPKLEPGAGLLELFIPVKCV